MKRIYRNTFITIAVLAILSAVLYPVIRRWGRMHVNYITATEDHPLACLSCHLPNSQNPIVAGIVNADYLSPFNLAISDDGKMLYAVAEEGNMLLVIDNDRNKVIDRIKVGTRPHSVRIDSKRNLAYVSNQWSDNISVIDLSTKSVKYTLKTGNGPAGIEMSSDNRFIYAVNSYSSDLSVIDAGSGAEVKRLSTGNNPTGITLSPDGNRLYVTSRRARIEPYGDPVVCELTIVNDNNQRIAEFTEMESAYMMENVAFTPDGELALIPLIRPKNLVPSIQIERGFIMTNGIGILEQKPDGRIIQLLLDEPNEYFADPFDIVITPDGKHAFVSHSGVDRISVINLDSLRKLITETPSDKLEFYSDHLGTSSKFVVKRIATGANPKGMVLSPDGKLLYVAEHLEDRIAVISTETLETVRTVDLGGPRRITVLRLGRRLLNNAGHTFQNQYSCYTCHPDTHEDGLVYNMASKDMGRNLTNTQSLRNIGDTPPYKWNGKNQTVYKQDGMRFSTVLTRTEAFSYKELDAISSYIMRGVPNPPNLLNNPTGELTPAQQRGKAIFERTHDFKGIEIPEKNRCITCHPAPYFTNKQMFDVGTLAASDDSILFDTPHLNNIFASPPYLHDGRAATLEEIWTLYGKTEQHGVVNDLTKIQLNELIEYLKSLRDPAYESEGTKKQIATVSH